MIRVFYHADCLDGWAAAYAMWTYNGSGAVYKPIQYGDPIPDCGPDDLVFFLDFGFDESVTRADLVELAGRVDRLCIIDHHKSGKERLEGFPGAVYDTTKSGCVLTWEYLYPVDTVPQLFEYVQDADLWTWKLDFSREVKAGLESLPRDDFDEWHRRAKRINLMLQDGEAILRYVDVQVARIAERAVEVELDGHRVLSVNGPRCWRSDLGHALALKSPSKIGVVWEYDAGQVRFSLRSTEDGPDVSELARGQGGGGHEHAAGFEVKKP